MWTRSKLPHSISTPTIDRPNGTSYDTICAALRRPPISEYLLFDAQPPRMMPYTPVDVSARISSSPTFTCVTTNVGGGPYGIRQKTRKAGISGSIGPRKYATFSALDGTMSSLRMNLIGSAMICSQAPRIPNSVRRDSVRAAPG